MNDGAAKIPIVIRRAHAGDARCLTEIATTAKRYWGYSEDLLLLWRDELTVTPDFIASHPVYLAVSDGDVAGFYALSFDGEIAELEHMWVYPPQMGGNVGRTLFSHAMDVARENGATMLRIASEPAAQGFYVRMGARLVGSVSSRPAGRELPLLEVDLAVPAKTAEESG
jgi:GNAT superfamily N-acetyltransferase